MKKQLIHIAARKNIIAALIACVFFQPLLLVLAVDMNQIQNSYKKLGGSQQNLSDWQAMLHDTNDLPINDKLKRVNEFFNRHIAYGENIDVWGQDDYWATPM